MAEIVHSPSAVLDDDMPKERTRARIVRKACAQLFIVCAARMDRGDRFGLGPDFLDKSTLGTRNLILLRDPYAENFQRGIGPRMASPAAVVEWYRQMQAEFSHVRETYAFGHSSGGYGAILFGHLMEVDRVFAFAPSVAKLDGAVPARAALVDAVRVHNGKTRYEIRYAPGNAVDHEFATRLGACPGFSLEPRPEFGAVHNVTGPLAMSGELARILPPFVAA
ncbi:MAG TPA: hypothetical protein VGM56_01415 [Byssovorax sp.]